MLHFKGPFYEATSTFATEISLQQVGIASLLSCSALTFNSKGCLLYFAKAAEFCTILTFMSFLDACSNAQMKHNKVQG